MRPAVSCTPHNTSSGEQTGNIITFTLFEEDHLLSETQNLFSETCDDMECNNKYDDNLTMQRLIIEEEMGVMSSGDESDAEPMSTKMLEDICDGSQSPPNLNRIEACYKIHD